MDNLLSIKDQNLLLSQISSFGNDERSKIMIMMKGSIRMLMMKGLKKMMIMKRSIKMIMMIGLKMMMIIKGLKMIMMMKGLKTMMIMKRSIRMIMMKGLKTMMMMKKSMRMKVSMMMIMNYQKIGMKVKVLLVILTIFMIEDILLHLKI